MQRGMRFFGMDTGNCCVNETYKHLCYLRLTRLKIAARFLRFCLFWPGLTIRTGVLLRPMDRPVKQVGSWYGKEVVGFVSFILAEAIRWVIGLVSQKVVSRLR